MEGLGLGDRLVVLRLLSSAARPIRVCDAATGRERMTNPTEQAAERKGLTGFLPPRP